MTDDLANVIRKLDDLEETRKALGATDDETCAEAAKRVMIELDRVRSQRDNAIAVREGIRKTLGADRMEPTIDAAKRMAKERDHARAKNRMLEDARSLANAAMKERDEALEKIRTIDTAIGRDGEHSTWTQIMMLRSALGAKGNEPLRIAAERLAQDMQQGAQLSLVQNELQADNQKLDETVERLKIDLQKAEERASRFGRLCEEIYNAVYWFGPCDLEAKTFEDRLRSKVAFVVKFASDSTLSLTAAFAANCATVDADSAYTWASMRTWCSEEKLKLVRLLVAKDGPV